MANPEKSSTPIGSMGKFGLIDHITRKIAPVSKSTVLGIGDDAAVIDNGNEATLVSTDLLLEGIHFNLVYTPFKHLGYKAVVRALSDIWAMNGSPAQLLVAIGISSRFFVEQIDDLYEGIYLACKKYKVDLAGGDITSSVTGLTISVTATGSSPVKDLVLRNGSKPNDLICVSGNFGASFMGLQILERERKLFDKDRSFQPSLEGYEYIIERQLKPEFPVEILTSLKKTGIRPTAMIDVSDGLASDLLHICKLSDTGCRIFYDRIPVDTETIRAAGELGLDPVTAALNGGEDNELLFTAPLVDADLIRTVPDVTIIGHMTTSDQGFHLVNEEGSEIELKAQGWEKN